MMWETLEFSHQELRYKMISNNIGECFHRNARRYEFKSHYFTSKAQFFSVSKYKIIHLLKTIESGLRTFNTSKCSVYNATIDSGVPDQSAISRRTECTVKWNLKFWRPQSDVKIHFQEGKTSFSFYYITENILKVTSTAMKLRVMEFYIHFYIRESGIKISWWWQSNLNISSFMPAKNFILKCG